MDGFARIGTALAKPQYYLTMFVAAILIIGGIWMIYKGYPTLWKYGMIVTGLIIGYLGHARYVLINSSPRYAGIFGAMDIFSLFR
jgi:hypothetical protein